jgi:hypothetical protein
MPTLTKIDANTFNVVTKVKNCNPAVVVLDGRKVRISNDYGTLVERGRYKDMVFVPDALLGEVRWTRVFNRRGKTQYDQVTVDSGVIFLFNPITA